jgi:hypothetical protein
MLEYINLKYFFLSFLLGITFIYLWGVDKKIIVVYPNPYDYIQYQDSSDKCFVFESKKVKCPDDVNKISMFPIQ